MVGYLSGFIVLCLALIIARSIWAECLKPYQDLKIGIAIQINNHIPTSVGFLTLGGRMAIKRPMPPDDMPLFVAAPEIYEWLHATIFNRDHAWFNPDHEHVFDYQVNELAFMWAHSGFDKAGKRVIGQCEKPMFMAGGWKRERQIMWFEDTLGEVPDMLITLDAQYCRECSYSDFAALVEHELYHIIHKLDNYGEPSFRADGKPRLDLVSHDVEEFNGVVRRYGGDEAVIKMTELQTQEPELKID